MAAKVAQIVYRQWMRVWFLLAAVFACGKTGPAAPPGPVPAAVPVPVPPPAIAPAAAPDNVAYPDLGAAIVATVPADARVIGFGELHARTDRAQVKSSLARFTTDGLPAIADKLSDLVVETWINDGKCGSASVEATAKIAVTTRRPIETKSEIALLADAARAKQVQPHAMHVTCADYDVIVPKGKDMDPVAMLTLTTRELTRISTEAVSHRDTEANHRPWIALYGGALHNDRFPDKSVAEWSYAAKLDQATHDHFVEIDLIVPELAEADPTSQKQPWFPLVTAADAKVHVWKRGERSFVFVLPRT
jgi:hypothetical protein